MTTELTAEKNIVFFSHGGGPMPILNDPSHDAMVTFMKSLPKQLKKPTAIIVISAHWEEDVVTTTGAQEPGIMYDYDGFPKEAYELTYPAKGAPTLATDIQETLTKKGIVSRVDMVREYDHGVYIPLKLMYPNADIPTIQVSLKDTLNAREHIALGIALRDFATQNTLIIGSGFSFHNMYEFRFDNQNIPDVKNDAFQDWLIDTCTNESYTQDQREKRLEQWENAPHARYCHPREEHLLPLLVCVGIANKAATKIFDDYILGKRAVAFKW